MCGEGPGQLDLSGRRVPHVPYVHSAAEAELSTPREVAGGAAPRASLSELQRVWGAVLVHPPCLSGEWTGRMLKPLAGCPQTREQPLIHERGEQPLVARGAAGSERVRLVLKRGAGEPGLHARQQLTMAACEPVEAAVACEVTRK